MITLSCPKEYLCIHEPGKQVKLEVTENVEQMYSASDTKYFPRSEPFHLL